MPLKPNLRNLPVLIVDDEPGNLQMLRDTLLHFKAPVFTAESAADALVVANQHPELRLILTDISMPERDGYDLLKDLRAIAHLVDTTIIALTANAMRGDEDRAIGAGFDGYISKPLPPPLELIPLILQIASKAVASRDSESKPASSPDHALQADVQDVTTSEQEASPIMVPLIPTLTGMRAREEGAPEADVTDDAIGSTHVRTQAQNDDAETSASERDEA